MSREQHCSYKNISQSGHSDSLCMCKQQHNKNNNNKYIFGKTFFCQQLFWPIYLLVKQFMVKKNFVSNIFQQLNRFCPRRLCDSQEETFFKESALGRFFHKVAISVCLFLFLSVCPFSCDFFQASHWPSDHMTRSRPLIGQPSFPTSFGAIAH